MLCDWLIAATYKHLDWKAGPVSRLRRVLALCALTLLAGNGVFSPPALAIDPHRLYEQNCSGCHAPHAGDFAHENLIASDGRMHGRESREEIREFLASGHGGLSAEGIGSLVEHLTNISRAGRLFHNKCKICHGRAVTFARKQLYLKDGKLIGRYSKRDIAHFLRDHGRLTADEVPTMAKTLERHLKTQGK